MKSGRSMLEQRALSLTSGSLCSHGSNLPQRHQIGIDTLKHKKGIA
ncbi:hypothetical protein X942_4734 [Burkholderia pseudomallei MSHR5596]|nr:hypothetical protein X942_4734 [Burkholderia pseudomallei MSHR5596]